MRRLFKNFILITFIGLICCSNFSCECSRCNGMSEEEDDNIESASSIEKVESIDAFDNANLGDVARDILPRDVFGQNIDTVGVINDMVNTHLYNSCPMIALMRISIVYKDEKVVHHSMYKDEKVVHHNVPYVFVSGNSGSNAIDRWNNIPEKTRSSQYRHLHSAINQKTGSGDNLKIYSIVKGINDYGFWCGPDFSQFYSHAERACILALMYDEHHSLAAVIINKTQQPNTFTQPLGAVNGNVRKIVVQIKISHKIGAICNECFRFLTGEACWSNERSNKNSCKYKFTNDTSHDIFSINECLRELSRGQLISIFIPIEIRISSNDLDGCCSVTCRFSY